MALVEPLGPGGGEETGRDVDESSSRPVRLGIGAIMPFHESGASVCSDVLDALRVTGDAEERALFFPGKFAGSNVPEFPVSRPLTECPVPERISGVEVRFCEPEVVSS